MRVDRRDLRVQRESPARLAEFGARLLLIALFLGATGCVTTPLENRDWWRVQTAHFDIWSALGKEETERLALQAEGFRTATEYLWGQTIPPAAIRTRIYAFDDRGIGRPYSHGNDRSYLLPRFDGDIIVLRTGGGWTSDARTPLKLAFARRLISHAAPDLPSPWLYEGMAQLASTLEVGGPGASVGILRDDHMNALRSDQWISLERVLSAEAMPRWSIRERSLYRAEAWALVHYLHLHDSQRRGSAAQLARYRSLRDQGADALEASRSAFGDDLQARVRRYVLEDVLPSTAIRIQRSGPTPEISPIAQTEILEELALLALAIDADERAERYLETAKEAGPVSNRAMRVFAALAARTGDAEAVDSAYRIAIDVAPNDALVRVEWADYLRTRAADELDAARRAELVSRARAEYAQAIALAPDLPSAFAGLAASALVPGEDPAEGIAPLARARQWLPGDTDLRYLGARLALASRDTATAREHALVLIAQAGSTGEVREAQALLEETEAQVTQP